MKKTKVIFLCTGNSARSQMAEVILSKYGSEYFEVYSAGFEPKGVNPYTIKVMEEKGFDMSNRTSKDLKTYLGKIHFGIVITVCDRAEKTCPTIPGVSKRLFWPFEDPAAFEGSEEDKINKFREVRDKIEEKIKSWVKEYESSREIGG
ncbi:MAG: Protein ArsC [Candidatus Methanofastidiosum methylothiophilum]|uniref:Protein ArsC n=1 Tax=Candidatus Methanofastidiosum methylothiophilum TaxID=1705564 RepID=A0A150IR70_9EURY|nr:MAG: Protein ArsC [Candidatus Methanofastidiosum methylthiophilus]KYC47466.1 MAG: Protein ArsC [Candidatus Methanofastidiosum methylthiophilus]KYC50025.1 MAG: Protein ArsC [Candidatus Methanofastidiosum methylthiophilus]